MKTFTIDTDNNISAFATPEEAAATTTTPFDTFASQKELLSLVKPWSEERLVAIWNSLAGVTPVKSFKTTKTAAAKIWERIQSLGETAKPKAAKAPATARAGSKTAQVVAMLRRKDGATLAEIMTQMGWQKHTVRGFMAGAMKKAGHAVESFKSEKGDR